LIHLLTNIYTTPNQQRQAEMDLCLKKNMALPFLNIHDVQPRPTFKQLFELSNNFGSNDIFVIANNDIYFDETLLLANQIKHGEVYALTRYDIKRGVPRFFDRQDSQDVWIWRGHIKDFNGGEFFQGVAGCDNSIAYQLVANGYKVTNPSLSIKTYHLHESGLRTFDYKTMEKVPPPYLLLEPTTL
jgi:hypothetical protein